MELREDLVKELTKDCKTQEDFNELFKALKKRGLEAALAGELTDHVH
jgi:putative transposase